MFRVLDTNTLWAYIWPSREAQVGHTPLAVLRYRRRMWASALEKPAFTVGSRQFGVPPSPWLGGKTACDAPDHSSETCISMPGEHAVSGTPGRF